MTLIKLNTAMIFINIDRNCAWVASGDMLEDERPSNSVATIKYISFVILLQFLKNSEQNIVVVEKIKIVNACQ